MRVFLRSSVKTPSPSPGVVGHSSVKMSCNVPVEGPDSWAAALRPPGQCISLPHHLPGLIMHNCFEPALNGFVASSRCGIVAVKSSGDVGGSQ